MAGKAAILSVKIIGDASKAVSEFNKAGSAATGIGGKIKGMLPSWQMIGTAVAGVAVAATKELYEIGETFDDVTDTIRVGTGATGDALDGLVDVAKSVGTQVPAEFEKIAPVVADLNTRLGVSGDTLDLLARQYLEAGRILGEDIDIQSTTAAMSAFGKSGDDASGAMDTLFRVSQGTGVGMNELADSMTKQAPALESLGFNFETSAALVGTLDKAGIDANRTISSMGRGLVTLARSGEEPSEAFQRVIGEIGNLVASGNDAAALDLAGTLFGTRGASQFVGAVKSGALNMDQLTAAAAGTGDTIIGVGEETADAAEKWQILKNKAMVALEPLGSAIFDGLGKALDFVLDLTDSIDFSAFSAAAGPMSEIGGFIGDIVIQLKDSLMPLFEALLPTVIALGESMRERFGGVIDVITGVIDVLTGIITGDWSKVWDGLKGIVEGAVNIVIGTIKGWISMFTGLFGGLGSKIGELWSSCWNGIVTFFSGIPGKISGTVRTISSTVVNGLKGLPGRLLSIGRDLVQGLINGIGSLGGAVFDAARNIASNVVSGIKGFLGIHSPSRVAHQLGAYFGIGLANGIAGQTGRVARAANLLARPMHDLEIPAPALAPAARSSAPAAAPTIIINGALDPVAVADQIRRILAADRARSGAAAIEVFAS